MTTKLLANQLRSILNEPVEGFAVELADESNMFVWRIWIEGPKDTCYSGGIFQLSLTFPKDYPMSPPELKFVSDFWHPNVFSTGKVCMSILHPPGEDVMSGELPEERWLPTQSVTTIILSLMSLLNDPNCASPANVDASVEWRNHRDTFKSRCVKLVEKAHRELPAHVVIPHPESDVDQHRRRVEKFHEMNKDLGYEDFYEDEADAGGGGENNESGDENEFLDSENEEINTDDEQSPKEMPRDLSAPTSPTTRNHDEEVSNDSAVKEDEVQLEMKEEKEKGKGKVEESRNIEVAVVSTTNKDNLSTASSSSAGAASEEVSGATSSQPPRADNSISSDSNSNSNNDNNNNAEASGPKSKKKAKKVKKNKKEKKCVVM